jgi:DNA-binding response OmpR family regulator
MNVLVLDDDAHVLTSIRSVLADRGLDVDCASGADEAASLAREKPYDFILVDYRMPNHDGLWFMEHARFARSTRVLLMTACVNRGVIDRMFALGACGYIIKPFDDEALVRQLDFHAGCSVCPPLSADDAHSRPAFTDSRAIA